MNLPAARSVRAVDADGRAPRLDAVLDASDSQGIRRDVP